MPPVVSKRVRRVLRLVDELELDSAERTALCHELDVRLEHADASGTTKRRSATAQPEATPAARTSPTRAGAPRAPAVARAATVARGSARSP